MALLASTPEGARDPAFRSVPFDEWLNTAEQGPFRWRAALRQPHLSSQQRLVTVVDVAVDGADLEKRRGRGELLILVQITDGDGRVFQDHGTIDLAKVEEGIRKSDVTYSQPVFVRPGDYRVAVAIYSTETKEHAVKRENLRVAPLKNDPLPQAWDGLPPVEFIPASETPDSWYLPEIPDRLHLPLETRTPARVEVLVNLTPSERASGSYRTQDRNLSALLPSLRAISDIESARLTTNVSLLDLARRKVTFRQESVHEPDWPKMRGALGETTPGAIDVKSLEDRSHNAQFFVSEVQRLAHEAGKDGLVVVLSGAVEFASGQELRVPQPAPGSAHIVYIRFQTQIRRLALMPPDARMGRVGMGRPAVLNGPRPTIDQLFDKLKPLQPELVEVRSPDEFRKALAGLMAEISRL